MGIVTEVQPRHQTMEDLSDTGFVLLRRYPKRPDPAQWEGLTYLDWKSGGDTNFAVLASATGGEDPRGFWEHGKPDKDGVWTANAAKAPALRDWTTSVGARFGRVRIIKLEPSIDYASVVERFLHQDDNNRLNPDGEGRVVRAWLNLTDDPDSYMLLREDRDDPATEHVDAVTGHLMSEPMFSGWGGATLAAGQPLYNLIEYHNGTVWPHDNALIAAGRARYGRRAQAARIATALFDAAPHLQYRLPEALIGAPRTTCPIPVPYPSACSPQAWATTTPLLLITTLLGLQPTSGGLHINPHLPDGLGRLALHDMPTRHRYADADPRAIRQGRPIPRRVNRGAARPAPDSE